MDERHRAAGAAEDDATPVIGAGDDGMVPVALGARSYEVRIGRGLLARAGAEIAPLLRRPRVAVICDANLAGAALERLEAGLGAAGIEAAVCMVPPGEGSKSWAQLQQVVEWLLAARVERDDMVLAFGGGVVGDLAGFAAAVLRRGVRFVQLPTTLLAQVDSSVGGKTGINSALGKNLIGAFHQPSLVLADIDVLQSLPRREFLAGYGEVVKYAALGDAEFFSWLEINGPRLHEDPSLLQRAVRHSVAMKAAIVSRDETETGERALLNLGHTFGHALEAATGYSARLLHGEGVAIGMTLAFALSQRLGLCPQEAPSRLRAHLADMGMMRDPAEIDGALPDAAGLIALMEQDKKMRDGRLRMILARDIGRAFQTDDVDREALAAVLSEALVGR